MKPADRAYDDLCRILLDGGLKPQDRLPPERDLAKQLSVSRMVLRGAMERLEAEGRLWRHVGQGTFVGPRPEKPSVKLSLITENTSPAEVLEIRLAIEPQIARMAALRATGFQIAEMMTLVQKGRAADNPATWEQWDGQFHRALCQSTGNRLMLSIFDSFNAMRSQPTWSRLRQAALTPERRQLYASQHEAILLAIHGRDTVQAELTMKSHIIEVSQSLLD